MKKIIFYLLCALLVFLPFSSWLVSLTGSGLISLSRDVIILAMAVLALFNFKKSLFKSSVFWLAVSFIGWGLLTFFWKEASALQWLKGFRFTFMPIIFFLALLNANFEENEKKTLCKIILFGGIVISALAILEFFGVKLPLTSSLSGNGALESVHYVGSSSLRRLQAVLAGPNALGLYLLTMSAFALGVFKEIRKNTLLFVILFMILLLFTFSRSAWLGAFVILIMLAFNFLKAKFGSIKSVFLIVGIIILLAISGVVADKKPVVNNLINHDTSSSLRLDQYKRIWQEKYEIGLLGRGSGTAGPSSQNRLDGGPNHWTENIYLDIFEELGLVGLVIYIALIVGVIVKSFRIKNRNEKITASAVLISFAISGIFINYYTGQVGLYLMWLVAGLFLLKENNG